MSLVTQPHNYLPPLYQSHIHPVSTLYLLPYLPQLSCICPRVTPPPPPLNLSSVKPPPRLKAKPRAPNMQPKERTACTEMWTTTLTCISTRNLSDFFSNSQISERQPFVPWYEPCLSGVNGWRCQVFMDRFVFVSPNSVRQHFGFKIVVDGKQVLVCFTFYGKWRDDHMKQMEVKIMSHSGHKSGLFFFFFCGCYLKCFASNLAVTSIWKVLIFFFFFKET